MAAEFALGPCLRQHAWSGELIDNYTATIYVYCNNGREEIVGVSVKFNQAMRQRFPKHHHA